MLDVPESHTDLLDGPHTAVVTTIGPDGLPQSSAVYYLAEDGHLRFSITTTRQKYRNLARRKVCTFMVIDPENTQRYLEVRGEARLEPDPDYRFRDAVLTKYGLSGSYDAPGTERVVVTLEPAKVHAHARPPSRRTS